jgi:hypothetical protein
MDIPSAKPPQRTVVSRDVGFKSTSIRRNITKTHRPTENSGPARHYSAWALGLVAQRQRPITGMRLA